MVEINQKRLLQEQGDCKKIVDCKDTNIITFTTWKWFFR